VVHRTWPLSPQATYTLSTTPPPPMLKLPLAPARVARTKRKLASSPPRNKWQVRLSLRSWPTEPLSVETARDTDPLLSVALLPTRHALFVHFTILARLTKIRIPSAPVAETMSQSYPVSRPRPPIAPTAVTTTLAHSSNVWLNLAQLAPPDLPPQCRLIKTPCI